MSALRLKGAALVLLALLAFLPPAFAPRAQPGSEAAGFPFVICTADGLVLLTPESGEGPEPAQPAHDLSCLACLLRLASPPPALADSLAAPAAAVAPAIVRAVADAAPSVPPHLRPDKTGPPAGA